MYFFCVRIYLVFVSWCSRIGRGAILANMCNYKTRISSLLLETQSHSLSACALTLAILNGDMSLLAGYQFEDEGATNLRILDIARDSRTRSDPHYENDDNDSSTKTYGFSWGPNPSGSLSNITYLEEHRDLFRLKPATLSIYGLNVCGILWKMKHLIKTPKTETQFASQWQKELVLQAAEGVLDFKEWSDWPEWRRQEGWQKLREQTQRQALLIREFSWRLLQELMESGNIDLVKTLWIYMQPLERDARLNQFSKHAPRPYSFQTIFGSLNPDTESNDVQRYDERDVINRLHSASLSSGGVQHPTLSRRIMEQVCNSGALICGIPINCPDRPESRVWFEACGENDLIFTPLTHLGDEVRISSSYRSEAVSWRVLRTGSVADNCEVLHCLGRRRGFYRFEELTPQFYVLDWVPIQNGKTIGFRLIITH